MLTVLRILDANTAREIAYSIIDPITHKKFENKFKDSLLRSSDYRPRKFNCLYNEPFTVSYNTARTKDENAATHVDLILSKELLYKDCGISNKENDFSSNFQSICLFNVDKMFKIVTNNKQSRSFLLRLEKKLSN